jgi:peroxiredoxin
MPRKRTESQVRARVHLASKRKTLKLLAAGGFSYFAGGLTNAARGQTNIAETMPSRAPDFVLPKFSSREGVGPPISLSGYKGQWVYLDFWASWCTPCLLSFPFMNEIHDAKASLGIQVVAISVDRKEDRLADFLRATPARFQVLWDAAGQVAKDYAVSTMPTSFLIHPKGFIVFEHKGFTVNTADSLRQTLKRHVSETA